MFLGDQIKFQTTAAIIIKTLFSDKNNILHNLTI